jgi:hypothetical protein
MVTTSYLPICVTPRGTSMMVPWMLRFGSLGMKVEVIARSSPGTGGRPGALPEWSGEVQRGDVALVATIWRCRCHRH